MHVVSQVDHASVKSDVNFNATSTEDLALQNIQVSGLGACRDPCNARAHCGDA